MKKPTLSGLASDLRCANAEAGRYLDELVPLRTEVARLRAELKKERDLLTGCDRLCGILAKALDFYQGGTGK